MQQMMAGAVGFSDGLDSEDDIYEEMSRSLNADTYDHSLLRQLMQDFQVPYQ
jgi:hypothetical protein